ncbi:hypothetical protein Rt10032_c03g1266 [Rhodotorula toruloides]|uniref:Uncharacterized protein n=1 Tax=Rhodotorula toruloides TaxID=5286 RepID=A0A511KA85_RHOTO|nr:hypothetical protein Rt10032_c03g1266 [Rhodotorula toruloides]
MQGKKRRDKQLKHGATGPSSLHHLRTFQLFFPSFVVSDPMHDLWANRSKQLLFLLSRYNPSAIQPVLDASARRLVEDCLAAGRPLISDDIGESLPDFTSRWENLRCAQRLTFVQRNLRLALHALDLDWPARQALVRFVQATILAERNVAERSAPVSPNETDPSVMPEDGRRRAGLQSLDLVTRLYVEEKESAFYGGKYEHLSVCRPTTHRLIHRALMIRMFGPVFVYAQWGLEAFIGDLRHSCASQHLEEMANRSQLRAITLAARLRHNLFDPALLEPEDTVSDYSPPTFRAATHRRLPGSALIAPRVDNPTLEPEEHADLGTDKDGKTYWAAEVLAYLSVDVRGAEPRLRVRLGKFGVLETYLGLYPIVKRGQYSATAFVGLEELRLPVGLMKRSQRPGEDEVYGIVTNARPKGTHRIAL